MAGALLALLAFPPAFPEALAVQRHAVAARTESGSPPGAEHLGAPTSKNPDARRATASDTAASTRPSAATRRLARRLDAVLAKAPRGAIVGVAVLSGATGETLYARNALRPLIPASNVKVFTVGAALHLRGPDSVFETEVLGAGPLESGTLKGSLVLRGGGDPSLTTEGLWGLVLDLEALGLRAIAGDLILDDSAFDRVQAPAAGDARYGGRPYGAYTSALTSNFNTVAVEIAPGPRPGAPARAVTVPRIAGLRLENRTRTASEKGEMPTVAVRIEESQKGGVAGTVTVSGRVSRGGSARRIWRAVDRPALLTGLLFKELMRRADISLEGRVRRGRAREGHRRLAGRESPPLGVLLRDVGKRSNNLFAEQILKTLSPEKPGSTRAGLGAVMRWLAGIGIDTVGMKLADGSGLSRNNRVTAMQLARTLRVSARNPRTGAEFRSAFAVAGTDGTLKRRLWEVKGLARGKTGYLSGVSTLSGWVAARGGGECFFAVLGNGIGPDPSAARALQDRIVKIIADEG